MKGSIAILAGGKSTRMGRDKALVPLAGKPMLLHLADRLAPAADHLFIAGGDASRYAHLGLPLCADQYQVSASLVGIYSALLASTGGGCMVAACDMPFVDVRLAHRLLELAPGHDAVVPVSPRGREPLLAYYSRSCLGRMGAAIEAGELSIARLLPELHVREVSGSELEQVCDPQWTFFNVNTPDALAQAENLIIGAGDGSNRSSGPLPLVCFVGRKNSGKTTLIERLVPRLLSRGVNPAYIKHDAHAFQMDRSGSDTWRVTQAGAACVSISSPDAVATLRRVERELSLEQLVTLLDCTPDLFVVEGYKGSAFDRIELCRSANGGSLLCAEEDLVAVISDDPGAASSVPVIDIDDIDGVLHLVMERYGLSGEAAGYGS